MSYLKKAWLTNHMWRRKSWQQSVSVRKLLEKHLVTSMNIWECLKMKKQLISQSVKQQALFQQSVLWSMNLVFTSGTILSKVRLNLKVATSVVTGLSRKKTVIQLIILQLWWMTIWWKFPMSFVEMTTLPIPLSSSWCTKRSVGKRHNLVTWPWLLTPKRVRNCPNVIQTRFNLSKITVRKATCLKPSSTLLPSLAGILAVKMKSSLVKNWSNSLMNIVSASLRLLLTKRN